MMRTDACAELHVLRYYSLIPADEEGRRKRAEQLQRLIDLIAGFEVEEIEIHHYGRDYVKDCPAIKAKDRKSLSGTDVYSRYGCTGCDYFKEIGLRHVRCRWQAAKDEESSGR